MPSFLDIAGGVNLGSPLTLGAVYLLNALGEVGIPFPFVMQSLLLFVGYHAGRGDLAVVGPLVAAAILGSSTGAFLVYSVSRRVGQELAHHHWHWLPHGSGWLAKAEARVKSAGPWAIAMGRFTPGLAVPVSVAAGASRVSPMVFMAGVGLSEIMGVGSLIAVGLLAGHLPYNVEGIMSIYPRVMLLLIAAMGLVALGRMVWRHHRAASGAEPPLDPLPAGRNPPSAAS